MSSDLPKPDAHSLRAMKETAKTLVKLTRLRGLPDIEIKVSDAGHYFCNGDDCGCSVIGVEQWMNKQPGVKP